MPPVEPSASEITGLGAKLECWGCGELIAAGPAWTEHTRRCLGTPWRQRIPPAKKQPQELPGGAP